MVDNVPEMGSISIYKETRYYAKPPSQQEHAPKVVQYIQHKK
jgi:hypothetical protein